MKRYRLGLFVIPMFAALLAACPEPGRKGGDDPMMEAGGSGGAAGTGGMSMPAVTAGSTGSSGGSGGGSSMAGSGGSMAGAGGSMAGAGGSAGRGGSGGMAMGGTGGARDAGVADAAKDGAAGGAASFKTDIAPLLAVKCKGCHAMADALTGYMWLQDMAAAGRPCAAKKRLDVVLSKIDPAAATMPMCGTKMPKPAMAGDAETFMKIRAWIMAGAMNN